MLAIDVYKTTGDADYLLKVEVKDVAGLSTLISQIFSVHKNVAHVKTLAVLNQLKENGLLTGA